MQDDAPSARPQPAGDLSPLAWVQAELRRSLEAANKALRRHHKEALAAGRSDIDAVDPAVLRGARVQLHQGVGALELIGLPAAAQVLRASEAAVQRMAQKPALVTLAAIDSLEQLSFALLDFLTRQLAGKPVSPLLLFPQYRAAQQLAGADRVHPADLWQVDSHWPDLSADPSAAARPADDAARGAMELLVLTLMRAPDGSALAHMSDLCADLGAGSRVARAAAGRMQTDATDVETAPVNGLAHVGIFWQLAAAVFEAQAVGLLESDVYTKRLASRLLAQLRLAERGQHALSDRLVQDLLFFCSHAKPPLAAGAAPRLAAVRRAWRLDLTPTADYQTSRLGRFDPAVLATARKRIGSAKDAWAAVAGGELHRLNGLQGQFALLGESLQRLLPAGERLDHALQRAAAQTVASGGAANAPLAMEVATGMLYLDASIEDGDLDDAALPERVQHLAQRIEDVCGGADAQPLQVWMEELYRRVSDRQTMGSVVQELRASLSEVEKQIDQYFRQPAQRALLIPVPGQLSAMRGVLSVLGMDDASLAVLHMRDEVDALAQTEADPARAVQTGTFDRLAHNLGALSFLIDMLSVQPQLAKSLFRYDAAAGSLSAVMGQTERVSAFSEFDDSAQGLPDVTTGPASVDVPPPSSPPLVFSTWPVVPPQTAPLFEQVQALAAAVAEPRVGDAELLQRLDLLSQQAVAADQPGLARALGGVRRALGASGDASQRQAQRAALAADLLSLAPAPAALPPVAPSAPIPLASDKPVAAGDTGLEDDAEMREIFIEEVREVVVEARACLQRLSDAPDNAADLTALRRAFHTLKGSARMVGLRDFGEAAWACEQAYNAHLARATQIDAPLRLLTVEALDYLADWTEAINAGRDDGHRSPPVVQAADALRLHGQRVAIAPPGLAVVTTLPLPMPLPVPLPVPEVSEFGEFIEVAAPPSAPRTQVLAPDLNLSFERLEAGPAHEPAHESAPEPTSVVDDAAWLEPVTTSLVERVPDLPSAADLDFGWPEPTVAADGAAVQPAEVVSFEFDLDLDLDLPLDAPGMDKATETTLDFSAPHTPALDHPAAQPTPAATPAFGASTRNDSASDEPVKVIGPLRISIPLFNIFLNEADEVSRRLCMDLGEWAVDADNHPVPVGSEVLAHSLAGSSATVGYSDLSGLARALEHALGRSHAAGNGRAGEAVLFIDAADEIRRLLHQFAAGFLRPVAPTLMERLAEHERLPAPPPEVPTEAAPEAALEVFPVALDVELEFDNAVSVPPPEPVVAHPAQPVVPVFVSPFSALVAGVPLAAPGARADAFDDDDIDAVDALDEELFPIFDEEASELLPQLQTRLQAWFAQPAEPAGAAACMRTLHTFKGGARLAGAMRLGEMAHRLETAIEHLVAHPPVQGRDIEPLMARADAMVAAFDVLRGPAVAPQVEVAPAALAVARPAPSFTPLTDFSPLPPTTFALPVVTVLSASLTSPMSSPLHRTASAAGEPFAIGETGPREINWQQFTPGLPAAAPDERPAAGAAVRVRAGLLDRLVNQAGEVSITRARIDSNIKQLQGSLNELTESLERMRRQLHDIELQAETQISTRMVAAKAAALEFDPLEMDRFTRFQELTRFMAESVNDVATVQRSLQRTLQSAEDDLAAQARLTRELQDDLLRTRMVEFESLADRLYRTVRQAAKEITKQVRLDIVGGAIEIDRGVLERMIGPFEHLLRNSVAHGIEAADARVAAGKDASGQITISVAQMGNEVAVEFSDDGAGLDLLRIEQQARARGLLSGDQVASDAELAQLIFAPGFSTATLVTELSGRGVGMDVVRSEVAAMGGRIETASARGQGTRFRLLLPLTTAVTQVVMLRCGGLTVAVPSSLIEVVRRVPSDQVVAAYASGQYAFGPDDTLPFFWLGALLLDSPRGGTAGRTQAVVVIRSAAQRVALHVDEVLGNQEVVVKNVGPQLARLPGLAGMTLLPSGAAALIYNPVALATLHAEAARAFMRQGAEPTAQVPVAQAAPSAPLVLVVDDSLTVRRVTQRLLVREGYRVTTAKDGLEALERLAEERPVMLLSDIEMPRMDGFDLVRNVRADERLRGLPVVMITSRIAQKHRDYAAQLGVEHYLGKPYSEDELLSLVARYAKAARAVH